MKRHGLACLFTLAALLTALLAGSASAAPLRSAGPIGAATQDCATPATGCNIQSATLSPARSSVAAGRTRRFAVVAFDQFGTDVGTPPAGTTLTIAPEGSCHGHVCTALTPGAHTVTATLGAIRASAQLTVIAVAPKLKLRLNRQHAVGVDLRTRRARIATTCQAPRGETCAVSGKLMARVQDHTVTLGTLKDRLPAGRHASLTITVSKPAAAALRTVGSLTATAAMRVTDLSGRGSAVVMLVLVRA
jgi:hypothetical protein